MIRAVVDRVLPIDLFNVSEEVQVFDRPTAYLIEHIFNHLKVLAALDDGGMADGIYQLCEHVYSWPPSSSGEEPDVLGTKRRIAAELHQLVALLADDHEGRGAEQRRRAAYEALKIPFLDYSYDRPSSLLPPDLAAATPQRQQRQASELRDAAADEQLRALLRKL